MAQHPEGREQERPEMEAVTHESKARSMCEQFVIAPRRLVDGVDWHGELSIVAPHGAKRNAGPTRLDLSRISFRSIRATSVSRPRFPWSTGLLPQRADRW